MSTLEPLSPEERAKFVRVARVLVANPSGLDGYGGWAEAFLRTVTESDRLAARVSSLETRLESAHRGLGEWRAKCEAMEAAGAERRSLREDMAQDSRDLAALREKAQEVRRAWDDPRHDFGHVPKGGCDKIEWTEATGHYETNLPCSCGHDALRAAIDALVPPVAPPEARARDECPNCWSAETGGRPNFDPADCIVCHGSGLAPHENEKETAP